ncbi:hypothetical protein WJX81_001557 [Elliptochloris bilobata]|uniref:TAFII28-like protein domain-containing protein n=1 Tax=Elliptochloris bilobata TaxID=381761 RepID=A0AAW1S0X9_9CHLO
MDQDDDDLEKELERGLAEAEAEAEVEAEAAARSGPEPGADGGQNQQILDSLTPEELARYEAFRRSTLNKTAMKRLLHNVTNQAPNPETAIVMCGVAKIFVGELIETARGSFIVHLSLHGRIPQQDQPAPQAPVRWL